MPDTTTTLTDHDHDENRIRTHPLGRCTKCGEPLRLAPCLNCGHPNPERPREDE